MDTLPFYDHTSELVCIADKEGYFRKVNTAVLQKLGYTEAELFERPISTFIVPEDQEKTKFERSKLVEGEALVHFQNRYITKNNGHIWLNWTSIYFPDKELVLAIAKDITEQKNKEQEIEEKYQKFKGLTSHFKTNIEKDRRQFANDLHEELAQLAAVVKMDLGAINQSIPDMQPAARQRLDHALAVSDLLIQSIRRISFSVSPYIFTHLGLNETLGFLCADFTKLSDIPCSFEADYKSENLPPEISLDFFRICQEALSNVMAHSAATNVCIHITETADSFSLCITDNGKGFDPYTYDQSSGIVNMRERAASVNGELKIESSPGKGTSVCVVIGKQN